MPQSPRKSAASPAVIVTGPPGAASAAIEPVGTSAPEELADRIAAAVTAHPAVVRLDGGAYDAILTWLPGRRLLGVRVGRPGEPVEIGVALRFGATIPDTVRDLRRNLAPLVDGAQIDVQITDVVLPGEDRST